MNNIDFISKEAEGCSVMNHITINSDKVIIGSCVNCSGGESGNEIANVKALIEASREGAQRHNEVLKYVGKNCDPVKTSKGERYALARNFLGLPNDWEARKPRITEINSTLSKGGTMVSLLKDRLSPEALVYVGEMDKIFSDAIHLMNTEHRAFNPNVFSDKIRDILEKILGFPFRIPPVVEYDPKTGNANDMGTIVGFCILAEESYSFWFDAAITEKDPWHGLLNEEHDDDLVMAGPPRWVRAVGRALKAVGHDIVSYCDYREKDNGILSSLGQAGADSVTGA
jgi:hypothetical protein